MNEQPKADIIKFGYINPFTNVLTGWVFDCKDRDVAAIRIADDGEMLYGGYTVQELRRRRSEFNRQLRNKIASALWDRFLNEIEVDK